MNILDQLHWTGGIAPVADVFAGTVNTDVVDCESAVGVLFLVHTGVQTGATSSTTITIQACDDTTPTTTAAVPFQYRVCTTMDTWGAWTQATVLGFATTPATNHQMYQIFVAAAELAEEGYGYVRLHAVEAVNDPVVGGIAIAVVQTRYQASGSLID